MSKIGQGKSHEITFDEADGMATLWHEITHNRNIPGYCNMDTTQTTFMELANEYVDRNTLPEFYKKLGCPSTPHPQYIKSRITTGYNDMVTNYDYIVTKLGLSFQKVLDTVRSHLYNQSYTDQENGLIDGLVKGGIKDKYGKKLKRSVVKALIDNIRSTENGYGWKNKKWSITKTKEQILDEWLKTNNII